MDFESTPLSKQISALHFPRFETKLRVEILGRSFGSNEIGELRRWKVVLKCSWTLSPLRFQNKFPPYTSLVLRPNSELKFWAAASNSNEIGELRRWKVVLKCSWTLSPLRFQNKFPPCTSLVLRPNSELKFWAAASNSDITTNDMCANVLK